MRGAAPKPFSATRPPACTTTWASSRCGGGLYPEIHELPAGYCALKAANFSAGEWAKAHVLHDPHLLHKSFRAGYAAAEMPAWLKRLDDETEQIFKEVIEPKLAEAFPPKRRRGRRKG